MEKIKIDSFEEFIDEVVDDHEQYLVLYRGQSEDKSLLPSIARENPKKNTTELEKEMLNELRRRAHSLVARDFKTEWEWLVYAQHYGMKTRLLDWTANPLAALWFACWNVYYLDKDSFVYVFVVDQNLILDTEKESSPFNHQTTKVFKPNLNNSRIVAQSGWFTAHKFSNKAKRFVGLENNSDLQYRIIQLRIPAKIKKEALVKLNIMGINHSTMFPDITGICDQINWEYFIKPSLNYKESEEK